MKKVIAILLGLVLVSANMDLSEEEIQFHSESEELGRALASQEMEADAEIEELHRELMETEGDDDQFAWGRSLAEDDQFAWGRGTSKDDQFAWGRGTAEDDQFAWGRGTSADDQFAWGRGTSADDQFAWGAQRELEQMENEEAEGVDAEEFSNSTVAETRALAEEGEGVEAVTGVESETGYRSAYCTGCCRRCDCGCTHGATVHSHAYPSKDGRRVVVVYEESYEVYKRRVERCTPKPPPQKCNMKIVVHHGTNEVEICKECIINKKNVLYHKCQDKVVLPVPPIKPHVHPPHLTQWHQVCTCTWVKNGPNYHGPRTVWHRHNNFAQQRRERNEYNQKLREYRQKLYNYNRKRNIYNAAKRRYDWQKAHDDAVARNYNRWKHEILESEAKRLGYHEKHHKMPLRVLCPCNSAGARALSMHESQITPLRELVTNALGEQAETFLEESIHNE